MEKNDLSRISFIFANNIKSLNQINEAKMTEYI